MFNKNVEITIITRFKNEDNYKINRFAGTWTNSEQPIMVNAISDKLVEIKFTANKLCVRKIEEQLKLITFLGIEAKMEIN